MIELRDYQAEDVAKIRAAFARGVRRVLYVLPTGGGKTVEFCHIAQSAAKKGTRTGILVHRQELLRQCSRSLEFSDVKHGMVAPGYSRTNDLIQIASVQTLVRRLNDVLPFKFLVVDEAHHSTAGSWEKIFNHYPDIMILGVTATPIRTDDSGLGEVFQEMIVGPSISRLMDEGYLCRAKLYAPPTQFTLEGISRRGGDYAKEELAARIDKPQIIGDTVAHYKRLCAGQPAIDFCVSIKHAEHSAERFRQAGFRWRVLDGTMTDEYREETIRWLGCGKLDGISSCDLISEGTDIPIVMVAINQRPSESLSLVLQQWGRVLRPIYAPNFNLKTISGRLAAIAASIKPHATILDHVGNVLKHGLPDMDREWSLSAKKRKNKAPRYTEEEDINIRQCPECYAVHKPGPRCTNCGHIYMVTSRLPSVGEGTLVEHTRTSLEAMMRNYKSLSDFMRQAERNGYTETWANSAFIQQNEKMRELRETLNANAHLPIVPTLGGETPPSMESAIKKYEFRSNAMV